MAEVALVVWLELVGTLAVLATGAPLGPRAAAAAGLPAGFAVYTAVALATLAARLPFDVVAVAVTTTVLVSAGAAVRRAVPPGTWAASAVAASAIAVLSALLQWVPLARFTPDSFDYMALGSVLASSGDLGAVPESMLAKRPVPIALLHAGAGEELYRPSVTPLLGVAGAASFAWIAWTALSRWGVPTSWRVALPASGLLLLAATQHVTYQLFFVNGHLMYATYLLLFAAGAWLRATFRERGWTNLSLLALPMLLTGRPEGPLIVAVLVVAMVAADLLRDREVLLVVGLSVLAVSAWHGAVLGPRLGIQHPAVAGPLVTAAGLAALASARRTRWRRAVSDLAPFAAGGVLVAVIAWGAVRDPSLLTRSAASTVENLGGPGYWGATWLVLPPAVAVAAAAADLPGRRWWITALVSFGLVWGALPVLRDGPYRPGFGDSGNRMILHILLVVLLHVVLSAGWRLRGASADRPGAPAARLGRVRA